MKALSKSEEKVLHLIWEQEPTYLKTILSSYPEPRPAKTTLATVLKRMINKGYIAFDTKGGIREYKSLVSKTSYLQEKLKGIIGSFFGSDSAQFASFFAEEIDHSDKEIAEIKEIYLDLIKKDKI